MNNDELFNLKSRQLIYKNAYINVVEDKIIWLNGNEGHFTTVKIKNGVFVLPIDDENNITLIREYKYALGEESIEVIGGGIEKSETPLLAAKRELLEEGGIIANRWIDCGVVIPHTNLISSKNYMFVAKELKHGVAIPEKTEFIELIKIPFEIAMEMVIGGKISHGTSVALILKLFNMIKKSNEIQECTYKHID